MTQHNPESYKQKLLTNRIATALGFEQLSDWLDAKSEALPGIPPSYLLVAFALILDMGILEAYNYFIGKNTVVDDPSRIFITAGIVLAVVGLRWLNETYAQSIATLQLPDRDLENGTESEERFKNLLSVRATIAVYLVVLALFYINLFVLLGFSTTVEIQGLVRAIAGNFFIFPFYVLLAIEFGMFYLSIHLLLPRRIIQADLNMFFYDPQNMGGFGLIGQLLKKSYYLYTAGLLLYFFLVYWPQILNDIINLNTVYPEAPAIVAVFLTVLWMVGICSIGYSMYRMHTLMSRKKREAIKDIEKEIKDHLDAPFDITTDHIEDSELRAEFEHRISEIRNTRQYPSTFTMWSQILISVLLPQVMQIALQILP